MSEGPAAARSVLIIAGEVSGDMHAAALVREARAAAPDLHSWGIGGDEMAAAGVEIVHHVRDMAVLGLGEVLRRYPFFRRVFRDLVEQANARRPDAVLSLLNAVNQNLNSSWDAPTEAQLIYLQQAEDRLRDMIDRLNDFVDEDVAEFGLRLRRLGISLLLQG